MQNSSEKESETRFTLQLLKANNYHLSQSPFRIYILLQILPITVFAKINFISHEEHTGRKNQNACCFQCKNKYNLSSTKTQPQCKQRYETKTIAKFLIHE